ncbi:MAG: hypothetical protein CVU00_01485 [Bacteroidetes bacterium HGW-Bacteroidetes-17]|jgi:uncharacterized protein (DUF302 family)|nr:MAG: hypothetical protein CVU00_01485 [Bacteroidetes bacterium HGW-Bacteroidetes-17]
MKYYINKTVNYTFEEAIERVTALLKEHGFGVLTTIDVKETLKKKIDVDFKRYTILGACNPQSAYKALSLEDKLGVLLPCNVIVIEQDSGIEVCAIDPYSMMGQLGNKELIQIAEEVNKHFQEVFEKL